MENKSYEFHALGSYKEKLFNLILKHELSDLLIDILMNQIEDERFDKIDNFLGGEFEYHNGSNIEHILLKRHLFDVPFIYSTVTDTRGCICIDTNITKCSNTLKEMIVNISVICHKDMLYVDNKTYQKYRDLGYIGRNRIDIATAILGDIINDSSKFGIGRFSPYPYDPTQSYFPNKDFWEKSLKYTCTDFMKDYTKI